MVIPHFVCVLCLSVPSLHLTDFHEISCDIIIACHELRNMDFGFLADIAALEQPAEVVVNFSMASLEVHPHVQHTHTAVKSFIERLMQSNHT